VLTPASEMSSAGTGSMMAPVHGRQILIEILVALWIPLVVLSAVQLLRLSDGTIEALVYNQWTSYSVTGAVLTLLVTEGVLATTLVIQLRRAARLEGKLCDNEDRLQLCSRAMNVGIWLWSAADRRLYMNDNCAALLTCRQTGHQGLHCMIEAAHPDDHAAVERAIRNAIGNKSGFEVEFRLRSLVRARLLPYASWPRCSKSAT